MDVDVGPADRQVEREFEEVDAHLAGWIPAGPLGIQIPEVLDEDQLFAHELLAMTSGHASGCMCCTTGAGQQVRRKVRVRRAAPSGADSNMSDQLDMASVKACMPLAGSYTNPAQALQHAALEASRQLQQDSRSWVAACGNDVEQFMGKLQEVLAPLVTALQATPCTAHVDPSQLRAELAGGLLQMNVVQQLSMHPSARGIFVQALQQLQGSASV